jgi:hypothetical protein
MKIKYLFPRGSLMGLRVLLMATSAHAGPIQRQIGATPEPPKFVLIGCALFGLGIIRRKKPARK